MFQTYRPAAVITSTLEDLESQLPCIAANKCNIPTISIPHGSGKTRNVNKIRSSYVMCSHRTQSIPIEMSGYPKTKILYCKGLFTEEYPFQNTLINKKKDILVILALTNPIGWGNGMAIFTSPKAQIEALKCLSKIHIYSGKKIEVYLKVHPNWPDISIINYSNHDLLKNILPINSHPADAINSADLIVAINYCGGALPFATELGKPLIFLWLDKLIGKSEPLLYVEHWKNAGIVLNDVNEFWKNVKEFIINAKFQKMLEEKSTLFYKNYLEDKNYPTFSFQLKHIITN
jgi:hypothetical protein